MILLTPLNNPVEPFGKVTAKFTSVSLNANSFLKSSMIQIKTSVRRPRPCRASPGRCEVSETADWQQIREPEACSTGPSGELTAESVNTHPFSLFGSREESQAVVISVVWACGFV